MILWLVKKNTPSKKENSNEQKEDECKAEESILIKASNSFEVFI